MDNQLSIFSVLIIAISLTTSCTMYEEVQKMKEPRYEAGIHKGAKFCAECHEEIYNQWKAKSRHAIATTAKSFLEFKDMFTDKFMLNAMMGESMCYACHGNKEVNEGVNCETCHGPVIPDVSIEETHERKFTPGRERMKQPDFCPKCHEMKNPMSGDFLMSLYSDWKGSEAAANGITCQGCHMKPQESEFRYHGFDTAVRNDGIYRDDVSIRDIKLNYPHFSLTIENHVKGHSIPAGGPTRTLALEMSFTDANGNELHRVVKTFAKKFELMPITGVMPYKLIENTQLQSGEIRPLSFTLPPSLKGQISKVLIKLRLYEVSDEYQGDIKKAHWTSNPILEETVNL